MSAYDCVHYQLSTGDQNYDSRPMDTLFDRLAASTAACAGNTDRASIVGWLSVCSSPHSNIP